MSGAIDKIDAYRRLGLASLGRGLVYRVGVRTGINPVQRIHQSIPPGEFFSKSARQVNDWPSLKWTESEHCFGWYKASRNAEFPDWFRDPIHNIKIEDPKKPWWKIPDFALNGCDIKCVWEASRFDWTLAMAQRAVAIGQSTQSNPIYFGDSELVRLNRWLTDWCSKNPPYQGPNWKCGQEASIRVLHLAMTSIVLYGASNETQGRGVKSTPPLVALILAHLKRIRPTIGYALAQNNNHGLSEAAALFVGGTWLSVDEAWLTETQVQGQGLACAKLGRRLIEDRVKKLFAADGSFSQYSVTYHRLALDTMAMVEVWRRNLGLPAFSDHFYEKAKAATAWLSEIVEPISGDAPNIGHNDGARLLPLTDSDYRDFRPTVQLAANLFFNMRAYSETGHWDLPVRWLGLEKQSEVMRQQGSRVLNDGGYAVLKNASGSVEARTDSRRTMVVVRYPRFRFRPSHADAMHVDLWLGSKNVLHDSGSYSYHSDRSLMKYFCGVESHNTIAFDARDQMPLVSRFLYGRWLSAVDQSPVISIKNDHQSFSVGYRDWKGASHRRCVTLSNQQLVVEDEIDGFQESAVLRWHLIPAEWKQHETVFKSDGLSIRVDSSIKPSRCEMSQHWESRYYWQKTNIPVIEVEFDSQVNIRTEINWAT